MGFKAGMVAQSSVCSTFGAGLTTACVVDVGHTRTSVVCVEEGGVVWGSRRAAPYGFSDVARLAGWLLRQPSYHSYYFPQIPYSREESAMHELIEGHASIYLRTCHCLQFTLIRVALIPERVQSTKIFEFRLINPPAPAVLYHTTISAVTSVS